MYWNENPPSIRLNDRLSKLEEELDQLISVQERIKEQSKVKLDSAPPFQKKIRDRCECRCVNLTACSRTLVRNRHAVTQCTADISTPIADITKFLQHINFNLSKGTQAINKLANANLHTKLDNHENKNYHESCSKKTENSSDHLSINLQGKKIDEDALFRELREEKDKRLRAENQTKRLKDELKKTKFELQDSANKTLLQLQNKFKDVLDQLEEAKHELEKRDQEFHRNEYLWPYKYETVCRQLQDEQVKKYEAEKKVTELQETLKKMYVDTKEYFELKETSSWLKEQIESLISLSKRLKGEVEDKTSEVIKKGRIIDQNLFKIQQLTTLCEKLKNFLILLKQKHFNAEEKLSQNQARCQKLTDKLLEAQSSSDQLKKLQVQDKIEYQRLSELFTSTNATNYALQARIEEMSSIMKQQNSLIAQQSDTISLKEEEIKSINENCSEQSKRLEEMEKMMSDHKNKHHLENKIEKLEIQLNIYKENIIIKEKIVESNLETISQLKSKLAKKEEDMNREKRELAEQEQKLAIEQTNNEKLQSKIKLLLNRKEELMRKVEELEDELENQISSDNSKRLEQIEKLVKEKQIEWEEHKTNLVKEKLEALQSLKKLEEDFTTKVDQYEERLKIYQIKMSEMNTQLSEKEEQLKEATENILELKTELLETVENAAKTKQSFEGKLQSACEAWQKTLQLLQN